MKRGNDRSMVALTRSSGGGVQIRQGVAGSRAREWTNGVGDQRGMGRGARRCEFMAMEGAVAVERSMTSLGRSGMRREKWGASLAPSYGGGDGV
jgi:hypothetical protein